MAYQEPADPLTGKGHRHAIASTLATLGLGKSIIAEPEVETEITTTSYASSTLADLTHAWIKVDDKKDYISWEAYLTPKTATKKDVVLILIADKLDRGNKWLIYYTIEWASGENTRNSHNFDIVEAKGKKEAEQKIEDFKSKARINDYLLIQNQNSVATIEKLLKTEYKVPKKIDLVWKEIWNKEDFIALESHFVDKENKIIGSSPSSRPRDGVWFIIKSEKFKDSNRWKVYYTIEWETPQGYHEDYTLQSVETIDKKGALRLIEQFKIMAKISDYLQIKNHRLKMVEELLKEDGVI